MLLLIINLPPVPKPSQAHVKNNDRPLSRQHSLTEEEAFLANVEHHNRIAAGDFGGIFRNTESEQTKAFIKEMGAKNIDEVIAIFMSDPKAKVGPLNKVPDSFSVFIKRLFNVSSQQRESQNPGAAMGG